MLRKDFDNESTSSSISANTNSNDYKFMEKRSELISKDSLTYENYKNDIFEEEVLSLKIEREEILSKKRAYLRKQENEIPPTEEFTKFEEEKCENIQKPEAATLTKKDVWILKDMLSKNEENYEKVLNYVTYLCKNYKNSRILVSNDCLWIICKNFNNTDIKSMNLIQASALAICSLINEDTKFHMVKPAVEKICRIFKSSLSLLEESLVQIFLWILLQSSQRSIKKAIKVIIKEKITQLLVTFLENENDRIKYYSLRIIGNLCCSSKYDHTQEFIDEGLIKYLKHFLENNFSIKFKKEAVWIVSNIAAGSQQQIETLIEENFCLILKSYLSCSNTRIRTEATWALCNLFMNQNPFHAEIMIEEGIVEELFTLLSNPSPKIVIIALEAFAHLLELDSIFFNFTSGDSTETSYSILKNILLPLGFIERLNLLQFDPNQVVYEKASSIIDKYLLEYREEEDYFCGLN